MSNALIEGPYQEVKFLGASVTSLQSQIGFQEQGSDLLITLVEDPDRGDIFMTPADGVPLSFQFQSFRFDGILQNGGKRKDPSGFPTYNVRLTTPTSYLEGVQLILDAYRGINLLCPNLLNVYGFLEDGGKNFGGSKKNESGIPWYLVKRAIESIQSGTTAYSAGINFYGYRYIVDMSNLPTPPDFYRLGAGVSTSLMQAIRTLCEDAGYDFIMTLKLSNDGSPHTIGFKTRSRRIQYPLGQIESFVQGRTDVVSYETGSELRNDITCGVLIGGDIEELITQADSGNGETIRPYWGTQESTILIPFGTEGNQPVVNDTTPADGNLYQVFLNASQIGDIIGDGINPPVYPCNMLEMRMAMSDKGFDSWGAYIVRNRQDILNWLNITDIPSIINSNSPAAFIQSMFTDSEIGLSMLVDVYKDRPEIFALQRIYEFVRSVGETYFGRQFMVRIPFFLKFYFESETNKIFYNMDPTGEAYWPDNAGPGALGPLGLYYQNFNFFSNDSSKFSPFVCYNQNLNLINAASLNSSDFVIQPNGIFAPCSMEPRIIYTPSPAVIIRLNTPMLTYMPDPVGGILDMSNLLGISPELLYRILDMRNGEFPIQIHPFPLYPNSSAICMKSNELTYGPWTNIGIPGPVKFIQDAGMTPWNYGGYDNMNKAALAQLADIGATNHTEESGSVTLVGAPIVSLGDNITSAGPIVTSIELNVGDQGLTTIYRMRSQTPFYGAFSRQNAERLRRLGVAAQDLRRNVRSLFTRSGDVAAIINSAGTFRSRFLASNSFDNPHQNSVLHSYLVTDPDTGNIFPITTTQGFPGALGHSNAHDVSKFRNTSSMGMEGLVRPFSTNLNPASGNILSHYVNPLVPTGQSITLREINPFVSGCDMLWLSSGPNFNGYNSQGSGFMSQDIRALGLRGPLVMEGWGYDLAGKPVPNKVANPSGTILYQNSSGNLDAFASGYLVNSSLWPVGPVDLKWDKFRGVWTAPAIIYGTVVSPSGGMLQSGVVKIDGYDDTLNVMNYLGGTAIPTGTKTYLGWEALKNTWVVIATACNN